MSPLRSRFRLGITARLSISFIGVALLILAANLLVQQGILVEHTTQVITPASPPAQIVVMAAPVVVPIQAPVPAPAVSPLVLEDALSALARFDQASQQRIKDAATPLDLQYSQAAVHLNDAMKRALQAFGIAPAGTASIKIHTDLKAYTAHATVLVEMADARRAAESGRTALLERLNIHVKEPLAAAWTIFGRVVSRQSLVSLSDDLDSLRRHSEPLQAGVPLAAVQLAEIEGAEQRVKKTLSENEAAFRRAQGDAWYQSMATDLAQLISLREKSVEQSTGLATGTQDFVEEGNQFRHGLFKIANTAPVRIATATAGSTPAAAATKTPLTPAATPLPIPVAAIPAVPKNETVSRLAPDSSSRRTLAWISGGAALLMVIMCVGIVASIVAPVRRLLRATAQIAAGEYSVRVESGGLTELDTLASAFNGMAGELAAAKQVSHTYQAGLEEKIQERTRRLQELSEQDPLTGLPNRRHLFALLNAAIERARTANHLIGVLFLDLDNFKNINDGLGHAFGDSVLAAMGARLAQLANGFAARLGGDEFTVVLERARTIEDISDCGEALVAAFNAPLLVEGRELAVSVSVGACAYPSHAQEAAALLKAADMALYRAKALGRRQLAVFTTDLMDVAAAKFATEQGLRRALDRGEFELYFQPELDAETLEIALVEALIRWRPPGGELLLPGAFMAIAEDSGLAIEIGNWVLRAAIGAAAGWHRGTWPDARVAINVSPRQMAALLEEFQLPARCIEIELTESVLQTGPATIASLNRLRELGVAVALDDFGTGFSSLASLELLPLTRVKLDRSLICGIHESARSAAIADAIIAMCRGLGLTITAEGIEEPEQFAYLMHQPAMCIQGFLLSHPVPRDELMTAFTRARERARELLLTAKVASLPRAMPAPAAALAIAM